MKRLLITCAFIAFASPAFAAGSVTKGDVQRLNLDQITLDSTVVTATGAEINAAADITTPGTVEASKGVIVDANKDISSFRNIGYSGVLTNTRAPSADSATTNKGVAVNLTSPVDTTGTNVHNAVDVGLTVGNASGGTNSVNAFNVGNVTGDAQVNVRGLKIGTGTTLGTSYAIDVGTGWDLGLAIASPVQNTYAASADGGATLFGSKILYTTPVDTTGTNIHYGLEISPTIGNASGGTNTFAGIKVDNVTGDAQVNVTGIDIGTGTVLGTSNGLNIGSGWDKAAELTSAATADSGATDMGVDINLTTPVDTTGTNIHYGLNIDTTIGNASGGTNTATAVNIANVSGDAQVTEKGIVIGTGFDTGLEVNSPVSVTNDLFGDGGDQFYGFLHDQVASTTVAITAAQADKTFVSNSADVMTLPEASTVLGARYTFVCGTADDFDINPADGTDVIGTVASITGTNTTTVLAPSAGDAIRCTDVGSTIVLEAVGADLWVSIGTANGIWTDVN